MKTKTIITRIYRGAVSAVLLTALGTSMSCMTTYDTAGRPVQSVDPGLAIAGVAVAGLIGYSMANDDHHYRQARYDRPARRYGGYGCR